MIFLLILWAPTHRLIFTCIVSPFLFRFSIFVFSFVFLSVSNYNFLLSLFYFLDFVFRLLSSFFILSFSFFVFQSCFRFPLFFALSFCARRALLAGPRIIFAERSEARAASWQFAYIIYYIKLYFNYFFLLTMYHSNNIY